VARARKHSSSGALNKGQEARALADEIKRESRICSGQTSLKLKEAKNELKKLIEKSRQG